MHTMVAVLTAGSASGFASLMVPLVIIIGVALLILWAVKTFFAEFYEPARIIFGVIVLVALLVKLVPLLGF